MCRRSQNPEKMEEMNHLQNHHSSKFRFKNTITKTLRKVLRRPSLPVVERFNYTVTKTLRRVLRRSFLPGIEDK